MPLRIVDDEKRSNRRAWAEQLAGAGFAPPACSRAPCPSSRRFSNAGRLRGIASPVIGAAGILRQAASPHRGSPLRSGQAAAVSGVRASSLPTISQ